MLPSLHHRPNSTAPAGNSFSYFNSLGQLDSEDGIMIVQSFRSIESL